MAIYRHVTKEFQDRIIRSTETHFGEMHTSTQIIAKGEEFLTSDHLFAQAYRAVDELGHSVDLHEYNVMMRLPERTLVITDPVT